MANIPFTNNYTDLSSQRGYQFKFHCEKCGNGYMSTFEASKLGTAAAAAHAAASLLGGGSLGAPHSRPRPSSPWWRAHSTTPL